MTMKKRWFALFTAPLFAVFIIVVIAPFLSGLYYSFVSWNGLPKNPMKFVGVENYVKVFNDARFMASLGRTTLFTLITMVSVNVLGLGFALIVTTKLRFRNVGRVMIFMPYLIGGLLLGYIWQFILGDCLSTLGQMTGRTDLFFYWLSNRQFAFVGLVVVATWQMAGYMMIIYIAGLQNVPGDLLEAAAIDGATGAQALFRVKLPMVMPSITICTFLTLTNSFKLFDQNLSLTGGEPAKASQMLALNIYDTFYQRSGAQWKGIGQAKAVVFFLLVIVIALIQLYFTRRKEVQQ